jgi:hypothetical protein
VAIPFAEVGVQVQVGSLGGSQPPGILHDPPLVRPLLVQIDRRIEA